MSDQLYLLSTVVSPKFASGIIAQIALTKDEFLALLPHVTKNLCGHQITDNVLREHCPSLPPAERGFWDGSGEAIAARPRGGVRGARAEGDTPVTIDDLEFVRYIWVPLERPDYPSYEWMAFVRHIAY